MLGERKKGHRWRKLHRVLGLAALAAVVGFVGLEINLRIAKGPIEIFNPLRGFHDGDSRLGWRGKPGIARRFHTREFDVLIEHDDDGFRRPSPPRPEQPRESILVLGDSIAWGWGVAQGEVFTDLLQQELSPEIAVYNRGVNAFSTGQEYLLLQQELEKRSHERILLLFSRTDATDNVDQKDHRPAFDLVEGSLVPRNQPAPAALGNPLERFIDEHSRATHFLSWQLAWLKNFLRSKNRVAEASEPQAPVDESSLPGHAVTLRLLHEISALAEQHGAELYLAYAPTGITSSEGPLDAALRRMVEHLCEEEGLSCVDLGVPLREATRQNAGVSFPRDGHWTALGHRLVARELLTWLAKENRVEKKGGKDAPLAVSAPGSE